MIAAKALYQGPHQSRAHIRFGDKRCRKQLTDIAIDVVDAVLRRNVSKIGSAVIALVLVVLVQGKWTSLDSWFAAVFASAVMAMVIDH